MTAAQYLQGIHAWNSLLAENLAALADVYILICPATMEPARPLAEVEYDMTAYSELNLRYLRNTATGSNRTRAVKPRIYRDYLGSGLELPDVRF